MLNPKIKFNPFGSSILIFGIYESGFSSGLFGQASSLKFVTNFFIENVV
jgi:hypothetical protein